MKVEKQSVNVNGFTYYVHTKEWFFGKVVVVNDRYFKSKGNTFIKTRDWFHRSNKSIDQLASEALNEAVCKREEKKHREKEYRNSIQQSLEVVKEEHQDR
jgi:uncharacterized HAD superfamily protein